MDEWLDEQRLAVVYVALALVVIYIRPKRPGDGGWRLSVDTAGSSSSLIHYDWSSQLCAWQDVRSLANPSAIRRKEQLIEHQSTSSPNETAGDDQHGHPET